MFVEKTFSFMSTSETRDPELFCRRTKVIKVGYVFGRGQQGIVNHNYVVGPRADVRPG